MSEQTIRITGGAGPAEAAAIVAAVQHLLTLEASAQAQPPRRANLSPWVRSAVRSPMSGPMTPTTLLTRRSIEDPGIS